MANRITVNCTTGEISEVAMTGAEALAYEALLSSILPPKSAIAETKVEDVRITGDTVTTLVSWPLATLTLYTARFTIMAINVTNGDCRVWTAKATAKRLNNGALLVGTPEVETSHANTGAASWVITADVSGNNFRIRVTGQAGQTISWSLLAEVIRARTDGLVD